MDLQITSESKGFTAVLAQKCFFSQYKTINVSSGCQPQWKIEHIIFRNMASPWCGFLYVSSSDKPEYGIYHTINRHMAIPNLMDQFMSLQDASLNKRLTTYSAENWFLPAMDLFMSLQVTTLNVWFITYVTYRHAAEFTYGSIYVLSKYRPTWNNYNIKAINVASTYYESIHVSSICQPL